MKRKLAFVKIILTLFLLFNTTNVKALDRSELEDRVVSTALSYLHNNNYTDYDQYAMDASTNMSYKNSKGEIKNSKSSTINWRNINISPEEISRTNLFSIDCSSFATIVYKYSLGYDFSEHYKVAQGLTYYSFDSKNNIFIRNTVQNANDIKTRLTQYGRGLNGRYFIAATALEAGVSSEKKEGSTADNVQDRILENIEKGKYYTFSNNQMGVFLYRLKESNNGKMTSELQTAYDKMVSILRPGDIINFVRETTDSNGNKQVSGHTMIYVGGAKGQGGVFGTPGLIHSGGTDYYTKDGTLNSISLSDDKYSVRFDTMDYLYGNRFTKNNITYISVVRPINKVLCGESICQGKTNETFTQNASARTAFKWLRVEQYARSLKPSINTTKLEEQAKEYNINISKYNSVNVGDTVEYTLLLQNNSRKSYCIGKTGGSYDSSSTCKDGNTWKAFGTAQTISNLVVTAPIPSNATFVECNYDCKINDKKNTLIWNVPAIQNGTYISVRYTVRVENGNSIENSGMQVKLGNNTLKMGQLTTKVNPTLNKINAEKFREKILEFKTAISPEKNLIIYGNSSTSYKVPSSGEKGKVSTFSSYGFVKNIYYNATGIELSDLSGSNIKNAIFNKDKNYDSYAKKTETDIKALNNTAYININKMLVKGFYGGRYLKGNDNGDRVGRLRITDLEFGDIIVIFGESNGSVTGTSTLYLYLGNTNLDSNLTSIENNKKGTFIKFSSGNKLTIYNESTSKTAHQFFNELWSKNLFVVLRPTQLYGTTVKYSSSTILGKNLSVEYGTYKNLKQLTSSKTYTLTLDYKDYKTNKDYTTYTDYKCDNTCNKTETGDNKFDGWYKEYTNKQYINKITSQNLSLLKKENHTIYPKWIKRTFTLPKSSITGYYIDSWYTDKNYTSLAAKAGEHYTIKVDQTLYAKWNANEYKIHYDSNGGTGTMKDTIHTYDIASPLAQNTFSKQGYIFEGWSTTKTGDIKFEEGQSIKNLTTTTNTITLYAKWSANKYKVHYDSNGGTGTMKDTIHTYDVTSKLSPNTFSKPGYIFEGWSTTKTGEIKYEDGQEIKSLTTEANTITLYAKWRANKYKVHYDANGGTGTMKDTTHTYDITSKLSPNTFSKPGYIFEGWSTTKTGEIKYEDGQEVKNLTTKTNTVTLYAKWKKQEKNEFEVSLKVKNGTATPNRKIVKHGETVTFEIKPNTGFKNCHIESETLKIIDNKLTIKNIEQNMTLDINCPGNFYTIIYNSNGGTGTMENTTHTYGRSENLKNNSYQKVGYTFKGWNTTPDNKVKYKDGENVINLTTNETLTLYAIWSEKIYTITYELNGGTLSNQINSYNVSSSDINIGQPKKLGYNFIGWTTEYDNIPQKNITIKKGSIGNKKYIANYDIGKYTVTYASDKYGNITGIKNEILEYEANPKGTTKNIKTGYKDLKWAVNKDVQLIDGTKILSGEPITEEQIKKIIVTEDIIITAYHYEKKYKVTYQNVSNGEITGITNEEVSHSSNLLGTEIKPNEGYEFKAWKADVNVKLNDGKVITSGKEINDIKQIIVTENITLTPIIAPGTYKIKYQSDANGIITGIKEETIKYPNVISSTTTESLDDNYEFMYWTADKNVILKNEEQIKKGDPITNEKMVLLIASSDITLTANYKQTTYSVYYLNYEDIIITGNPKELIGKNDFLVGPQLEGNKIDEEIVYICDKDVTLTNGKIIKAGNKLTQEELETIIVSEDLNITPRYINDLKISESRDNNINIVITVILSISIVLTVGYILKKRKQ